MHVLGSGRVALGRPTCVRRVTLVVPSCSRAFHGKLIPQQVDVANTAGAICSASARRPARGVVKVQAFLNKLFKNDPSIGTRKKYQARVDQINAMEPALQSLTDEQLRIKTKEFKERVRNGESLESVLPEVFAVRLLRKASAVRLDGPSVVTFTGCLRELPTYPHVCSTVSASEGQILQWARTHIAVSPGHGRYGD